MEHAPSRAIALLGPLSQASANSASFMVRRDHHDYRHLATHRCVPDDSTVGSLDDARVQGEIEVGSAPLVVEVVERDVGSPDIGDVTFDEQGEHRFGIA
jgi:hypothetical protein